MKQICGLILAAGEGKRIGAAEKGIPKVMFPVKGRPMIRYGIDHLKAAGIEDIVLVVGFERQKLIDYLKDEVDFAVQEEQKGTGHAVTMAKDNILGKYAATCVSYGDHVLYKPETIKRLIELYQKDRPTIAMLTCRFDDPNHYAFGRIIRNQEGEIIANVEQKDCNEEQKEIKECNPCFYIFDSEWLFANLPKLSKNNAQGEYYLTDLIAIAVEQGKKISSTQVEDWHEVIGINNLEHLEEVEKFL
jgi:bifunctional UDP-N-acetylglucosamine pyrophosphorylase/glucosamine-1-phosphate N-acetyltransferase